jgi:WXG100 family type VII secretion target
MAKLNLSADQLRAMSSAYRQEADELRVRMVRLARRTDPLRDDWVGSASATFQTLGQSVESHQAQLVATLEDMAAALASAAAAYESADANISSAFEG